MFGSDLDAANMASKIAQLDPRRDASTGGAAVTKQPQYKKTAPRHPCRPGADQGRAQEKKMASQLALKSRSSRVRWRSVGAATSSIIRETEDLLARLEGEGKQPQLYVYGRRGVSYYHYRNRPLAQSWEGDTEKPGVEVANAISRALLKAYMEPVDEGGVAELYIVYTEFINMVVQKVRVLRMLPVEVVKEDKSHLNVPDTTTAPQVRPLYSFEPSLDEVLDTVLPRYVRSRIHECLFEAAASEVACRQNAMHTATENARDLINDLTRKLNASRQASITQELTEIIGSADALNKKEE
jgi:F-type H+-transporting ATPase subunit gamma